MKTSCSILILSCDKNKKLLEFFLEQFDINWKECKYDIYISLDKARSQSIEYGHSYLRELSFLVIHGFLHLLGYDHMNEEDEKIMFKLQEDILDGYGIKR